MEFKEILELIKFVSKSGVSEVNLETGNFKIRIRSESGRSQNVTAPVRQEPGSAQPLPVANRPVNNPSPESAVPTVTEQVIEPVKEIKTEAGSDSLYTLKAPMVGTFYRSPSPDKPPFFNAGDEIKKGQVICIIEAMKLFNEIESDVSGKIVQLLVDDAKPVEFDQPLFLIRKE
ncbi:MAG: acetyl-CoA carboxylase biotin carboxyl carrier protein [Bacteroidetes bacterium]|nr:acetyl-CoA carboxylase biotin carboxyl carrier protein [Bacteroidota bacterium]